MPALRTMQGMNPVRMYTTQVCPYCVRAKMLLQVHDELLLECPKEELEKTVALVKEVMESAYTLSIPLETDAAWGTNWGDLKEEK